MLINPLMKLEVIIVKEDDMYTASAPSFPECLGIGATEEEALKDLGDSITIFLEEVIDETIHKILKSKANTEIMVDPAKKRTVKRKIINLQDIENKQENESKKTIFRMKVPVKKDLPFKKEQNPFMEMVIKPASISDLDMLNLNQGNNISGILDATSSFSTSFPQDFPEGIMLGFPVNLN